MKAQKRVKTYIAFALCVLISLAAVVFNVTDRRNMARAAYDALTEEVVSERTYVNADMPEAPAEEEEEEPEEEEDDDGWDGEGADLTVDFDTLLEENGDTIGWIHIPAVDVSYPLLYYAENNDYYINRDFDKRYSAAGVIYLECTNNPDLEDPNSLIYGHNMADGSMFGDLHKIQTDEDLYTEHPYFYIYKPDGTVNRYSIFSYYPTQKGSLTYSTIISKEGYDYYSDMAENNSVRDIDVSFEDDPPIVTLSTCHGAAGTTKRFVVHGILDGRCDLSKIDRDRAEAEDDDTSKP